MSFESVLDAATEMLKRRRRVTYRLLQREFDLDDAALADLKDELILAQRVARDEDGVLLVWTAASDDASAAERRRLTVMFCDLVGSTRLSNLLDPEDLREVMRNYYEECAAVLRPSGGHIAQYLGDGVLVYFGYPVANEDDAGRAVRAGLSITRAVQALSARLASRVAGGLAVRVGIHTGLVVVGSLGSDSANPGILALGEAPNIAAHIQACAEPNTVVVSQETLALLPDRFITEDLGPRILKDPSRPVRLARVVGELEAPGGRPGRAQLVDPEGHLAALRAAWADARAGAGPAVALRGEPGLGKTRLTEELCAGALADGARVLVLRCSAFHRQSALHPIAQYLLQHAGLNPDAPGDDAPDRLHALLRADGIEHDDAPTLLAALAAPAAPAAAFSRAMAPAVLMQSLQGLLLDWLGRAARRGPALVVWEDVHWADPSTLALLKRVLDGAPVAGRLTLVTSRLDFIPPWTTGQIPRAITLERLGAAAVRDLVREVAAGRALAPTLVDRIVETAEGVPLYAEQITRAVLESAADAMTITVPATLHASLTSRLDRMGPAKSVAQTASLLGRQFSTDLLEAVCDLPPRELARALRQLTAGDILQHEAGTTPPRYAFRHALLQAAASGSLLRTVRRETHRRIAQVLQTRFSETVLAEPETLARHLSEAGDTLPAIRQWERAGGHALARSAVAEAVAHLSQGLELLPALPAGRERDALELALQIPAASALRAVQGVAAPATGAAYERATELARTLGDQARLIPALNGLYAYHLVRGQCDEAMAPARQLLDAARANGDVLFEMIGHRAVGAVAFHVGDPVTARGHLERALAMYDPKQHAPLALTLGIDHQIVTSNFLALTLLVLGQADAALAVHDAGLAWADRLDHAHSTAQALVFGCLLHALHEDWAAVPLLAERTIDVGRKRGFPLMEGGGRFFLGAARAMTGELDAGLRAMTEGVNQWWGTGARNYRPYCELLLARVHARAGDPATARSLLENAHLGVASTGERWVEAELWRARGELLAGPDGGEADLRRALEVARAQGAAGLAARAEGALRTRGLA